VLLVDPLPRTLEMICDPPTRARLQALGPLATHEDGPMPDELVERHLPETWAILGQTAMPRERLDRAPNLRAIVNVEGNFLPNVDYAACLDRGVHVLNASPAFALPVAEAALGMAIDLARGITQADRAMRAGTETYGLESNEDAFLLAGSPVGIVGFGDLGRELRRLIAPFGSVVKVHDPWLPDELIRRHEAEPAPLDDVLAQRVIFVFASVTADNEGFLGRSQLELIRPGSVLLLMSRAGIVDFDALVELVAAGRFRAATDVSVSSTAVFGSNRDGSHAGSLATRCLYVSTAIANGSGPASVPHMSSEPGTSNGGYKTRPVRGCFTSETSARAVSTCSVVRHPGPSSPLHASTFGSKRQLLGLSRTPSFTPSFASHASITAL